MLPLNYDVMLSVLEHMDVDTMANAYEAGVLTNEHLAHVVDLTLTHNNMNAFHKLRDSISLRSLRIASSFQEALNFKLNTSRLTSLHVDKLLDPNNVFATDCDHISMIDFTELQRLTLPEFVNRNNYETDVICLPQCVSLIMTKPMRRIDYDSWSDCDDIPSYNPLQIYAPNIEEYVGSVVHFQTPVPRLRKLHLNQVVNTFTFVEMIGMLIEGDPDDIRIEELSMIETKHPIFCTDWVTQLPKLQRLYLNQTIAPISERFAAHLASGKWLLTHLAILMDMSRDIVINLPECVELQLVTRSLPSATIQVTIICPKLSDEALNFDANVIRVVRRA